MRYAIGIDLGGTHINAASVSESGEILDRVTGETRDRAAPGTWVETILGGGIARAGDALLDPLVKFLADVEWRPLGGVRVELAALAEMAGALGAAQRALAP